MEQFNLFRKAGMIELPDTPLLILCYGGGVDSTGLLIKLHRENIRPDVITFADVGAEKPATYETVRIMNDWCLSVGFPAITICRLNTKDSTPYDSIEGHQTANATLPSIAFGQKACSAKGHAVQHDYYTRGSKGAVHRC